VQDAIGKWILAAQGTGAWEGYRGPGTPSDYPAPDVNALALADMPQRRNALMPTVVNYQLDPRAFMRPVNALRQA
jgi:hypothetical protein